MRGPRVLSNLAGSGVGRLVGYEACGERRDGPRATDYTGVGATVAGGLLIGVGIAAALRGRAAAPPLAHASGQGGLSA